MLVAQREDGLAVTLLEEREGVLRPLVAHQSLEPRDLQRLGERVGVVVGRADGSYLAGPHQIVERLQRLLVRGIGIAVVCHIQRNPLETETREAGL